MINFHFEPIVTFQRREIHRHAAVRIARRTETEDEKRISKKEKTFVDLLVRRDRRRRGQLTDRGFSKGIGGVREISNHVVDLLQRGDANDVDEGVLLPISNAFR